MSEATPTSKKAAATPTTADSTTRQRDVHLVLPAFNEEEALSPLLGRVRALRWDDSTRLRVVVVDDGSTDSTAVVAETWGRDQQLELVRHSVNQGLGQTLRDGLLQALKNAHAEDVVVTMDADNTQPPELIDAMLKRIDEGHDLVIASRYQRGARVHGLSRVRRLLSDVASCLFRLVLPIRGVRDYTCGFRAYRADLLRRIVERHGDAFCARRGFECMVDLLLRADAEGARCAEVPLVLRYDQKRGASKMPVAKTVANTLKLLWSWRRQRSQR